MIGTVFLWMFWPSFNSAPGASGDEHRYVAVINTYLALCSACVATFIASTLTNPKKKITMEHIQNATLAGGVAMGTASDMDVTPAGALAIGFAAGVLSTVGYAYIKPTLASALKLHDTCGVNNLHGMPAVMAAVISIIVTAMNPSPFVQDGKEVMWLNQLYCLLCTLGLAIVSGGITGTILRIPQIESLGDYEYFEDGKYWELEEEEEED
jgi:ammonium transporter Rh